MPNTRIATCCYCGTRAALEVSGGERHELVCSSCGAPLSKIEAAQAQTQMVPTKDQKSQELDLVDLAERFFEGKSKKKKKSKSKKAVKGIFDFIEDIFD